ncbi:8-oxo-dGTP diphosphatase [Natronincola peptidivorans]|uniref:8-oxo-dGTP diphosphatase n=1 Tax=Natronincola peptidivorans TaxID=426128 RepID=A0A1I0BVU3_9FIRM|nr:8-oxo-dGTP diphosphatase MutT [Natronincola peptidivorans]SET11073.1 8-oxo-dGTP diphosphatase [Natronincola peptidivorans]
MIEVAAAIIVDQEGRILIAKRKEGQKRGGLWEFPGGKIEVGETPEKCLKRELKEEMNIDIKVNEYFGENIYAYEDITIKLLAYYAEILKGSIQLKDHDTYKWVKSKSLGNYAFAAADVQFVKELIKVEL